MTSDIYEVAKLLLEKPTEKQSVIRLLAPVWGNVLEARKTGVGWADIGLRLAEAGLRRSDGLPFTPSTLTWVARRLSRVSTDVRPRRIAATQVHDPPPPLKRAQTISEEPAGFIVPPEVEELLASKPKPKTNIDDLLKEYEK